MSNVTTCFQLKASFYCLLELVHILSGPHIALAESLNAIGELYRGKGMFFKADIYYSRALCIRLQLFQCQLTLKEKETATEKETEREKERLKEKETEISCCLHPLVAEIHNNQGLLQYALGNIDRAHDLLQSSLSAREHRLGQSHPAVAQTLNSLAGYVQRRTNTTVYSTSSTMMPAPLILLLYY